MRSQLPFVMSYCLNPRCPKPENTNDGRFCLSCGSKLLLKERYRAIKPIGQGGFGRTFLAIDEDKPSRPRCVIKQFYPQAQGTNTLQKAVELFNQEAMRLDELGRHPQIPELLAYFTQEDRQYLVQEFIDGQNLAEELAQYGAYNEAKIRQLLNDLLPVLQFCYQQQVIHRDIKPENIIRRRSDGKPVLVDFGASKFATYTTLNQTGTSIGSPEYVAPEQMRGKALFASDLYSLGVTCINLLTAQSPFELYDMHNDAWLWQQHLPNPVSQQLANILDKMLASAPIRRYKLPQEVLADLNSQGWVNTAPPPPPIQVTNATQIPPSSTTRANVTKAPTQIDIELEEMKTMFLRGNKPQNPQSAKPPVAPPQSPKPPVAPPQSPKPPVAPPQSPTKPPSQPGEIDKELEELKKKYMGNQGS